VLNPNDYDFASLKAASAGGGSWVATFAYWIGVLSDTSHQFARDAVAAGKAMSLQYDAEEQAIELDNLRSDPEIIPSVFNPVAPITLALKWSPFPAAFAALGEPLHVDRGKAAKILAIFRPVAAPTFPASTADERHFQFLLRHTCERALATKYWVFLAGSPGWSYESKDYIADDPDLQELMSDFGFVYQARKPANA
jgi:hypothetical protein